MIGVGIGIVMGSISDWDTMKGATEILKEFGIPFEVKVVSAHRTPDLLFQYAEKAKGRLLAIIAGAGGAAHLPGMLAAKTRIPVLGVPVVSSVLRGMDSLLSIVQMPQGVPVATFSIGYPGAVNAALYVAAQLAVYDPKVDKALIAYRERQTQAVMDQKICDELTRLSFNP